MILSCSTTKSPRSRRKIARAFSLIEILVSAAVISVLLALSVGALGRVMERGKQTREFAAGRTLISAYVSAAADNDGQLMPAYQKHHPNVPLPDGRTISGEPAARWAWRLAPYFDHHMDNIVLVNDAKRQSAANPTGAELGYDESLLTSFGVNAYYVGGWYDNTINGVPSEPMIPVSEIATRITQVAKPSSLLVFATARMEDYSGHFYVQAPRFVSRAPGVTVADPDWNGAEGTSDAQGTGYLDPRHQGKVLCAFLDGSLRLHAVEELKNDMRLWSRNAQQADDANYRPTLAGGSTGGGRGGR